MCLNVQCRPEGRRYKNVSRTGSDTDSVAPEASGLESLFAIHLWVGPKCPTHKPPAGTWRDQAPAVSYDGLEHGSRITSHPSLSLRASESRPLSCASAASPA